jgi:hypothetical protein
VNRFHVAENGDDDEDDDEEEEERRHDEEEEEEEPVWTASSALTGTTRFLRGLRSTCSWSGDCRFAADGADRDKKRPSRRSAHGGIAPSLPRITRIQ